MLKANYNLAKECGIKDENVFLIEDGEILELNKISIADISPLATIVVEWQRMDWQWPQPRDVAKDLAEIPENVKNELEIIPVSDINEVLAHALTNSLQEIEWSEEEQAALQANMMNQNPAPAGSTPMTH